MAAPRTRAAPRAALKMESRASDVTSVANTPRLFRPTPSALGAAMADGPLSEVLLRRLEAADGGLDSAELAAELRVEHQAVVGAVKSLQALGEVRGTRDAPISPWVGVFPAFGPDPPWALVDAFLGRPDRGVPHHRRSPFSPRGRSW